MNGIFNVLKPSGMSSSEVITRLRRLAGQKKMGHIGTLDPAAAGVLPVMAGRATRLFDVLNDHGKEYLWECRLGVETDTLDAEGQVVRRLPVPDLTDEDVRAALRDMTGCITQVPPLYSALVYQGKKLYDLARKGKAVPEIKSREVVIDEAELVERPAPDRLLVRIRCSKGTYVRSYCRDLAERLGTCGTVSCLLRTRTGSYGLEEAWTLPQLEERAAAGGLAGCMQPLDETLAFLPAIELPDDAFHAITNGVAAPYAGSLPDGLVRLHCRGQLIGLGRESWAKDRPGVKVSIFLMES